MDARSNDSAHSLNPPGSFLCFHGDALTLEYYAAVVVQEFFDDYRGYFGDFNDYLNCSNPGDKASFIAGHFCAFQVMFGMPCTMLQICNFPDPISASSSSPMSSVTVNMVDNDDETPMVPPVVVAGAPCQNFSGMAMVTAAASAEPVSSSPTPQTPTSLPRPSPPSPDEDIPMVPPVVVAGAPCQNFSGVAMVTAAASAEPVSSSPTPQTPTSLPRPSPPSPDEDIP